MEKTLQERFTEWDVRFIRMAELVSTWSKDPSTKTGAVIIRPNKTVVGIGFNGFPQSMPDVKEWYDNREEKYSRVVHCEINAMIFANGPITGCTLYTWPFLSCDRCGVQMLQAGIKRFVCPEPTADALTRWAPAFEKVRRYIWESGATVNEISRVELGLEP